jgi:lipopolysaccharide export system permease protein
MKVLNRYIGLEVVKGTLISSLILLALLSFFTFTDELGDLGKGDYRLQEIFRYLLLMSPRNFYELLPSAALIGSLFTLGAMASSQELVAMRASGASLRAIIWAVLRAGLALALVAVAVGEWIAPRAEQEAQMYRAAAQKKQVALRTKFGFWLRDGEVYINIRKMIDVTRLEDINIYQVDERHHLEASTHADRANYAGNKWRLENMRRSDFEEGRVKVTTTLKTDWDSVLDPGLLSVVVVSPENLSIHDLRRYILHLRANGQNARPFELAFWGRVMTPIATLVMLFVTLPLVLNTQVRTGVGQRIVAGTVIGLGFNLFDKLFSHLALIYDLHPFFAAVFPASAFFIAAWLAFRRIF